MAGVAGAVAEFLFVHDAKRSDESWELRQVEIAPIVHRGSSQEYPFLHRFLTRRRLFLRSRWGGAASAPPLSLRDLRPGAAAVSSLRLRAGIARHSPRPEDIARRMHPPSSFPHDVLPVFRCRGTVLVFLVIEPSSASVCGIQKHSPKGEGRLRCALPLFFNLARVLYSAVARSRSPNDVCLAGPRTPLGC